MKNKLDLHHIRAKVAQEAYRYYEDRFSSDENYGAKLTAELKAHWELYNKKNPWDDGCVRASTLSVVAIESWPRSTASPPATTVSS